MIALAITALWWQLSERRARRAVAELAQARARLAALADSLRSLPGRDSRGSSSPILADLARHPELIPYEAVLGGTMRFVPSECRVLSDDWVYGAFEDGHIAGGTLLEYRIAPGGRVLWKRLVAEHE